MKKVSLLILALICWGCTHEDRSVQREVDPMQSVGMRRSFILPDHVTKAAPDMQAHLYKVLPYHSPRFIVKPEFVFLDMDREVRGQVHPHVVHMNFLHLAYYKKDRLSWSGSLLLGAGRGWMGFAERGHQVKMAFMDGTYKLSFADGTAKAETNIDPETNSEQWLDCGDHRLYVHYVPLPKVNQGVEIPSSSKKFKQGLEP